MGLFESMLQAEIGPDDPLRSAKEGLRAVGRPDLAELLNCYQLAVNVLKHGDGQSYRRLLEQTDQLPFKVKTKDQAFFDEGDVSEIPLLVDADEAFVGGLADTIEATLHAIKIRY